MIAPMLGPEAADLTRGPRMEPIHKPVMVDEVLKDLDLKPGDVVVDGTLGLAGHAQRFVEAIGTDGTLVGFDWDETMLEQAGARLREHTGTRLHLAHKDFRSIPAVLQDLCLRPDAIFLDLGLNSAQIEDPQRGIAFKSVGPLDMRMDRSSGEPASALLNRLSPNEIERILWELGNERWAKAIARRVVEQRKTRPLTTTNDLVEAVLAAVPAGARDKRIHPATRTFQAVRIAVNRELEELESAVVEAAETLRTGGRIVVLSYHSGEDRQIKAAFRGLGASGRFQELHKKPLQPSSGETAANPRSRSAKLRALKRR
jgi:16S rRNA (cytosine1402-N4)-methyltransferase